MPPTTSTQQRKSNMIRDNLNCLRRFFMDGSDHLRKNRCRRQSDCFDNDANILALSCTAADEETVPLSPNRAERIVCKDILNVDNTHSINNDNLEHRTGLTKGIEHIQHSANIFLCFVFPLIIIELYCLLKNIICFPYFTTNFFLLILESTIIMF